MNAISFLKTGAEAKALSAKELHKLTGKPPFGAVDDEATLAALPVWRRTSTTLAAKQVYPTHAAILENSTVLDAALPRVDGWKKILGEIEWNKHGFAARLLKQAIFWHHQSTSGRFNETLQRFERWGVKSAEEWCSALSAKIPNPHYKAKGHWGWSDAEKHKKQPFVERIEKEPARTDFFRIKKRLMELGLIECEQHIRADPNAWQKVNLKKAGKWDGGAGWLQKAIWIKPTEELSRIVFEPGYWETVRAKYAYVKVKGKPRGVHAPKAKSGHALPKNGTILS